MIDQVEVEPETSGLPALALPRGALVRFALACNVFLSAFLLFQVQLVLGKYLLPMFGGAPSVWIACVLCFQLLLLAGYFYSHFLSTRLAVRSQANWHTVLLLAALLLVVFLCFRWPSPLTPGADWKPHASDNPVLKISQLLAVAAALPFFVLSTTGPLFQSWFAQMEARRSPYRLYALSNAGSLLALLSYPFVVEWLLPLKGQSYAWAAGYIVFIALSLVLASRMRRASGSSPCPKATSDAAVIHQPDSPAPSASRPALWIALSACSSMMLLATTNLLCQELTSLPLLWVLPMSLYLLSFMITFDHSRWYRRIVFLPLYFFAVGISLRPKALGFHGETPDTLWQMGLYCVALFAVCMACHGELARSKPAARHLTSFYLLVATGGAIGGLFVVLLAPVIFTGFWEFRVALLLCGVLFFVAVRLQERRESWDRTSWSIAAAILLTFLLPHFVQLFSPGTSSLLTQEYYTGALVALVIAGYYFLRLRSKAAPQTDIAAIGFGFQPWAALILLGCFGALTYFYTVRASRSVIYRERNFFGVKYILDLPATINLMSGSTVHGIEVKDPEKQHLPTGYYRRDSGVGLLLRSYPRGSEGKENLRVGVIGLGVGTLAAYAQPGDYFRFYEIDPALLPMSFAPQPYFHFLKNTQARVEISMGDARLALDREAAHGNLQNFNVLVCDAFSSDAVPVHLLTREAMDLYLRHMRTDRGVLAFHVSSRFVDLAPVIAGLSDAYRLAAVEVRDTYSTWILASAHPELLRMGYLQARSEPIPLKRKPLLWSDDYSNVAAVLNH